MDFNIGTALRRLVTRSGMTQDEVAQAMGYRRASSIQRYLDDAWRGVLKLDLAEKFARALVGKGDPPITAEDIYELAGVEITDRGTFRPAAGPGAYNMARHEFAVDPIAGPVLIRGDVIRLPKDLPVYGTALGGSLEFATPDNHNVAIEQTNLRTGEVLDYMRRPPKMLGNDQAHVLYLQGSSMEPKFEDGEAILVDPKRPVRARDFVVVTLQRQEDEDIEPEAAAVMVKRLVRRSTEFVDLEQYNPPAVFRIPMKKVMRISPVVPWGEAMGF